MHRASEMRESVHLRRSWPRHTVCHRTARSVPTLQLCVFYSSARCPDQSRSRPDCGAHPQCAACTDCRGSDLRHTTTSTVSQSVAWRCKYKSNVNLYSAYTLNIFVGLLRFYDSIFGSVSVRFCTENRGFGFSRFRFYVKFG